jgi:cytochrome b
MTQHPTQQSATTEVKVWDIGVRVFHWSLVLLMIGAIATVKIGGNAMVYHSYCGYGILALLLFRIIWGFVGGTHARFFNFITGPGRVIAYLKTMLKRDHDTTVGHNPMGALSVVAMLAALLFQSISGLFVNDDILFEGPFSSWVGKEMSDKITGWHKFNEKILITLFLLHMGAIFFYLIYKKVNLIKPMLNGVKKLTGDVPESRSGSASLAFFLLAMCAATVYWLVNYGVKLLAK